MKVQKADIVAICQDYGYRMADGWDEARLTKKLSELIQIGRAGEFSPSEKKLGSILTALMEAGEFEIVEYDFDGPEAEEKGEELDGLDEFEEEKEEEKDDSLALLQSLLERHVIKSPQRRVLEAVVEEEEKEEEKEKEEKQEQGEDIKINCPLSEGQCVLVHGDDEVWKARVHEIISDDYVVVRDRKGELWEESIERLEVVERVPKKKSLKPADSEDAEIECLQEQISALKGKQKTAGGRTKKQKFTRNELSLEVLRADADDALVDEMAAEVDAMFVKQGGQSNVRASANALERVVKYGVLFGILRREGRKVVWSGE